MTYLTEYPSKFVSDHVRNSQTGIHALCIAIESILNFGRREEHPLHSCFVTIWIWVNLK